MRRTGIVIILLLTGLFILSSCGGSKTLPPTPTSFSNNTKLETNAISFPVVTPVFTPVTFKPVLAITEIVYITLTDEKYHREGCRYLWKNQIPIERTEAINRNYAPCPVCRP